MRIKIQGINNNEEFEFPEVTIADEEARLKRIIEVKKQYKDALDIDEVKALAEQEGAFAFFASILSRVDKNVTSDTIKKFSLKEQRKLSRALMEKLAEVAEGEGGVDFFHGKQK
ncbi:MAG: hypothetical protein H5T45_01480 [Thermoplasmatales archaeon]|nr:hypothetical protein [Thermoplasmatales archaeon]